MYLRDVIGLVRPSGLSFCNSSNYIIHLVQIDFCFDHRLNYQSQFWKAWPISWLMLTWQRKEIWNNSEGGFCLNLHCCWRSDAVYRKGRWSWDSSTLQCLWGKTHLNLVRTHHIKWSTSKPFAFGCKVRLPFLFIETDKKYYVLLWSQFVKLKSTLQAASEALGDLKFGTWMSTWLHLLDCLKSIHLGKWVNSHTMFRVII